MPAPKEPKGANRKFTDEQLRELLDKGWNGPRIAAHFQCSKQAVSNRIKQLKLTTTAAAVAPEESKLFVQSTRFELDLLEESMRRVKLLEDACHRWLQDPNNGEQYDVGVRAEEIDVIYWPLDEDGEPVGKRPKKRKLHLLLAEIREFGQHAPLTHEVKRSDPRDLILATVTRCESTLRLWRDLTDKLQNAETVRIWLEELRSALNEADPEFARGVAQKVQRRLCLVGAFRGADALPAGRSRDDRDGSGPEA